MKESGLTHFLGTLVTILTDTESNNQIVAFQGMLLDYDNNFVYLDRSLAGEVDTAISIKKITAIEFFEDTPDVADKDAKEVLLDTKEEFEKLLDSLKQITFDDDDDGNLQ